MGRRPTGDVGTAAAAAAAAAGAGSRRPDDDEEARRMSRDRSKANFASRLQKDPCPEEKEVAEVRAAAPQRAGTPVAVPPEMAVCCR